MSRKSCLLTFILLILVPVLLIGGAGAFTYITYLKQKAEIIRKVEAMPGFNEEEEGKELAAELKMNYPVRKPEKDLRELKVLVNKYVREQVSKKYSARYKSKKMLSILRNFAVARKGKRISFQLIRRANQNSGDIIRGVYKGMEPGGVGEELIIVGSQRYPYSRVIPDNRYLFNERESKLKQEKHIKEFKEEFDKAKKEYAETIKAEYEVKIVKEAGYFKNQEGKWVPESDAFEKALADKRKAFDKKRKAKVKKMINKSKVFGLIKVDFSKSEMKEMMSGGSMDSDEDDSDADEEKASSEDKKEKKDDES